MMINALNSGASVFMADFEDSLSPSWRNVVTGQQACIEAVRRTLTFTSPEGKSYALGAKTATLVIRPRGWHLPEKHITVDGKPISASLFDFGLYFFHNAKTLMAKGTGPYFYLPKLEHYLEARLWNDVFVFAQDYCSVPQGTIRATVLIETILGAFHMDEILWELRDHSAGLNCGRWDYIYSFIKKFAEDPACVMPDRAQITMTSHFLRSYSLLLIKTCHRREIHAMGGMAAQIPIREDPAANEAAMEKVSADKLREAGDGHDGTWVAHPGLVAIAKEAFDREIIDPSWLDYQDFEDDLTLALLNPTEPWGHNRDEYALFGDTIEELSTWYCFSEKYRQERERLRNMVLAPLFPPSEPTRNLLRGIGRNDPCPCGSGKEYKKCCLN